MNYFWYILVKSPSNNRLIDECEREYTNFIYLVYNLLRVTVTDFSRERLEADVERFEVAGLALTSCMSEELHHSSMGAADPAKD